MKLVLIKYNAGNIQSVLNALERLGVQAIVSDDKEEISTADKVIFPGVGHAKTAMESLQAANLDAVIKSLKQPVLGICVGMQLLCTHSEEEDTTGLGILPIAVKRFRATNPAGEGLGARSGRLNDDLLKLKVPQVGWNTIYDLKSELFKNVPEKSYIYNVHSYFAEDSEYTIATCSYGVAYAAAVKKDNFYGVQFHTEKSAATGDAILKNFLRYPVLCHHEKLSSNNTQLTQLYNVSIQTRSKSGSYFKRQLYHSRNRYYRRQVRALNPRRLQPKENL
jgi:glutamine amidotransferase